MMELGVVLMSAKLREGAGSRKRQTSAPKNRKA